MSETAEPRERLDKWLWKARFFKTRALAAAAAKDGKIRVNGARVEKPGAAVKLGDVLTIARGARVTVVSVQAFGERRGPAEEAQGLYREIPG